VPAAAIVFAAAPLQPTPRLRARLAAVADPFVVAADDGATTALRFGLRPDVVIGDLDSLAPATLAQLRARGTPIDIFPRDKDATDGQLAVERALQVDPRELLLLGFLGGPRLDQALANVLLLSRVAARTFLLDAQNEAVLLCPGQAHTWQPEAGEVISLLPLGGDADGVHTTGLRWPLSGGRLLFGDTRGVSNAAVAHTASVRLLNSGRLLVTRHFPA
jgi:thiamine pyrophosphokinase